MDAETKARFVKEHRGSLIQNVSTVMAIVDGLGDKVHRENYAKIKAEKTTMGQMRELYETTLDPLGINIRAVFYDALIKHQPHLLKNLGGSVPDEPMDGPRACPGSEAGGGVDEEELVGLFHPFDGPHPPEPPARKPASPPTKHIDECMSKVCSAHQQCRNTEGGYQCSDSCPVGTTRAENGTCMDIDECQDGSHECRSPQICQNNVGGYGCLCPKGYRSQGIGRGCQDIDECQDGSHECRSPQICQNNVGGYGCLCPKGYRSQGIGRGCQDIDECLQTPNPCSDSHVCDNVPGSFRCLEEEMPILMFDLPPYH